MPTVLVTGANRGVGLALARRYAGRGDEVLACAREPAKAKDLADLAKSTGRVRVVALDVTDETAVAALAASIKEPIDIVICNAGVMSIRVGFGEPGLDAAEWHRVLATNVVGVHLTAHHLLPHLERAQGAKLAVISSQMGSSSQAYGTVLAYRVSKAAAANLGLNISASLKSKGIAVGVYHPGWVSTDLGGSSAPTTPEQSAAGLVARIDKLSLATTGVFEDFEGKPYPY